MKNISKRKRNGKERKGEKKWVGIRTRIKKKEIIKERNTKKYCTRNLKMKILF